MGIYIKVAVEEAQVPGILKVYMVMQVEIGQWRYGSCGRPG